ncbi:MAG: GGDEF domain-containing protein, partial [Candidatus Sedimenticola sp. 6PFRAG1]
DDFELVGYEAGDLLLQEISQRLRQSVREEDTVARIGGDEFTLVVRGTDDKTLERIANQTIELINQPVKIDDRSFTVGASVGISRYPLDSKDPDGLICQADAAMYEAKKQGKNRCIYYSGKEPVQQD